ncbi:protease inhibitor [Streptomyces sp. ISL-36]|uniref:SSI family serine proteinase inhibitor n=1 Tax=Streptomyces sp. ISL-36 TaxID=2819182 RepID=UPI001BED3537|nr:SSI family serine proteinase inhibitor [Streptomyces sp. ISL-36]MBT2439980.1 protease inhibitor [Streptomyces sp. ISL-36]
MNKILSAFATAALLSTGTAGAAHAAVAPEPEVASILLTISAADGSWTEAVRLSCPGEPGVDHPERERACADLAEADGDLDALHALPQPAHARTCVSSNDAVIATARGTYKGHAVNWERSYENTCQLEADTASLFTF